ncbi:MAG: F420-0:Gamma-glutamyl ligase [Bacillota bacterium]|nr:F420-0:Gamma-glutamyl ligase [Bacillota bacterium]
MAHRTVIGSIPLRTHILTNEDDVLEVVRRYAGELAEPGDIIAISETALAIMQGRAVWSRDVRYGWLARFLSRFPDPEGSLATPQAMQLAINEAGVMRILAGCVAAALGRLLGKRGYFYIVAGRGLARIDDVAGTLWPYHRHIVLGPRDPQQVVRRVKQTLGIDVAVVDVNDAGCVDILACTADIGESVLVESLRDNPFGNDDQQTPLLLLKVRTNE